MANERMDALCVREDKNGKSWFTKLGSAFPTRDGLGFTVLLDAVPAPTEGQYKIILTVPKPKDATAQNRSGGHPRDASYAPADDSDLPF